MKCAERHPELGYACTLTGNHEKCSGFDVDDLDADFVDWVNPNYVATGRVARQGAEQTLKRLVGSVAPPDRPLTTAGFQAGLEASESAAEAWTDAQKKLVDEAIRAVALAHANGGEFTSDAIWDRLAGSVPVTKGLTARLMMAKRRGVLDSTGKTEISNRGGHHDHGQRLSLWYSLLSA